MGELEKTIQQRYYFNSSELLFSFSLIYQGVSELLWERGISVHPTMIMCWVHKYVILIYEIWKKNKKAQSSWKLDKTYTKVQGE